MFQAHAYLNHLCINRSVSHFQRFNSNTAVSPRPPLDQICAPATLQLYLPILTYGYTGKRCKHWFAFFLTHTGHHTLTNHTPAHLPEVDLTQFFHWLITMNWATLSDYTQNSALFRCIRTKMDGTQFSAPGVGLPMTPIRPIC